MFRKTHSIDSWRWLVSRTILLLAATITTLAQGEEVESVVEVPISQLTQIQSELQYLRHKEVERTSRENTLHQLASFRTSQCDVGCDPVGCDGSCENGCNGACDGGCENACDACDACRMSGCDTFGGLCGCLCHGCVRPICPAPCIDCPRVTTLNPYFNIRLFGALKLDMLMNSARAVSPGVPFFLTPSSPFGFNDDTVSFHARQSTLGAAFTGPEFGGFQSGGQVIAMLFNDSVIQDTYGFLPLQAFGELKNDRWRFAAGLQFDVFAPGIPTVLPFSALAASGNVGNSFRGQLRLERYFVMANDVQWTAQMALSEPISTTVDPTFRLLEDNGWPNIEGRLALGLGDRSGPLGLRPFELGVSGLVGELRNTDVGAGRRVVTDVWGGAIDLRWAVAPGFGVLGEVFTGKAIGTYNGGILQNVNSVTLDGIRTSGGFVEGYAYLTPRLHTHLGYGIDDPRNEDVPDAAASFGRTKNQTYYTNFLWDVNQTFRVGFEIAYRDTEYKSPALLDNQGVGFHTQLQWSY